MSEPGRARRLHGWRFWRPVFWHRLFRSPSWRAHEAECNSAIEGLLARGLIEPAPRGYRATPAAFDALKPFELP